MRLVNTSKRDAYSQQQQPFSTSSKVNATWFRPVWISTHISWFWAPFLSISICISSIFLRRFRIWNEYCVLLHKKTHGKTPPKHFSCKTEVTHGSDTQCELILKQELKNINKIKGKSRIRCSPPAITISWIHELNYKNKNKVNKWGFFWALDSSVWSIELYFGVS